MILTAMMKRGFAELVNGKPSHRFLRLHFENMIVPNEYFVSGSENVLNKVHVNIKIDKLVIVY
jgi:hypothetical protein